MIVILTTVYNCELYLEKCIKSIKSQVYQDWVCYLTDDLSTDNSVDVIKKLISNDDRFILVENKEKKYQPGNYDQIIRNNEDIYDEDIIVEIDGDDWLPDNKVLYRIQDVYRDKNVWITNGSFVYKNGTPGFSIKQESIDNLRNVRFTASHLRTWRAFLWRKIKEEDLKDENGLYWSVAGDLSFMYPMLEMATEKHYKFLSSVNYVYNNENPINDFKVNLTKVHEIEQKLRKKTPYQPL